MFLAVKRVSLKKKLDCLEHSKDQAACLPELKGRRPKGRGRILCASQELEEFSHIKVQAT